MIWGMYPKDLLTLIASFQKLPGVGKKTAERFAFQVIDWPKEDLEGFAKVVGEIQENLAHCERCGCLMDATACSFCANERRQKSKLCIVATAREVYAIEETGIFHGLYHVLGSLLSPLDGMTTEDLHLDRLYGRLEEVDEVIIALDATLEGDATALFLKEELGRRGKEVTRLAFGLPMGSSLDYVDASTLTHAFSYRTPIS